MIARCEITRIFLYICIACALIQIVSTNVVTVQLANSEDTVDLDTLLAGIFGDTTGDEKTPTTVRIVHEKKSNTESLSEPLLYNIILGGTSTATSPTVQKVKTNIESTSQVNSEISLDLNTILAALYAPSNQRTTQSIENNSNSNSKIELGLDTVLPAIFAPTRQRETPKFKRAAIIEEPLLQHILRKNV